MIKAGMTPLNPEVVLDRDSRRLLFHCKLKIQREDNCIEVSANSGTPEGAVDGVELAIKNLLGAATVELKEWREIVMKDKAGD